MIGHGFVYGHLVQRAVSALFALLLLALSVGLQPSALAAPGALEPAQPDGDLAVAVGQVDLSGYPEVKLYVTVTGSGGDPVLGVPSDAISVDEDGATMAVKAVANVGEQADPEPIKIVLAMDTSSSVRGQAIEDMKAAATEFAKDLDPRDKVALVGFNENVNNIHPFTNNTNVVREGVASLQAGGGTALYEAIHRSAEIVDEETEGRRAFVLLTDGWNDTTLPRTLAEAAERAVAANAPGYVLGFGSAYDVALQQIADETGGRYLRKPRSSDVRGLFAELTGLIASQYEITYDTRLTADNKSHDFSVTVEQDGRSATGTKSVLITPADIPTPAASPSPRGTARATPTATAPGDDPGVLPPGYICAEEDDDGNCVRGCPDGDEDGECDPAFPSWLLGVLLAGLAAVLFLAARNRRGPVEEADTTIVRDVGIEKGVPSTPPPVGLGQVQMAAPDETMISRPADVATAWLIGLNEEVDQRRFPLRSEGRGQTTFGRGTDNTYTLDGGGTVSRHHAMVKFEHGRYVLRDLGARNPTLVNGRAVTRQALKDDDRIKLGRLEFVFKLHEQAKGSGKQG